MGNAILKIGEQTKDKSGISNSRIKGERGRRKSASQKPKSDNRINPKPMGNVDTKRLNKGNTRTGSLNKNASVLRNKIVLDKRNHVKSNASKTNGHNFGIKTSVCDEKQKRIQIQELSTHQQSKSPVAATMISVPTARRERVQHLLANDILLQTNDIMAMVDKWKKEEARLQRDYEDTQQKIRVSLRQEHQAKAEAQTWRVQLEKLAHSHRERLFRQATLLRSRLRSAERQLLSTEQKVKGLATANNKLKGMIDKANEKARSVQLHSERKREEAKRELKDKLKSVETELQHLTEKILSSGLMEESSKTNYSRAEDSKPSQANSRHGAIKKISGRKWKQIPADLIPTSVYELSAIGIPQSYLPTSCSQQMPQFSYNAYPLAVLPQSNRNKINSQFPPKTHQPVSRVPTLHRRQQKKTERDNRGRIPASKICPSYTQIDGNVGVNNAFSTSYYTTKENVNHVEYSTNPPFCCYISDENENTSNVRRGLVNKRANDATLDRQRSNYDMTNKGQRKTRNTSGTRFETSREGITPCEKCHGFNKQRLVVQQREVYNEFARARDRAAISIAYEPSAGQRNYTAGNVGHSHNLLADHPRDETLIGNANAKKIRDTKVSCNCDEYNGKTTSTTSPLDSSHSYRLNTSDDHNPPESSTAAESASTHRLDQGYFGDFERTASSLEVMKRRRIIHRRVATENRTR